jgi:hypothetical protein
MTSIGGKNSGLKLLEQTLETYGAERTRWPAQVRRDLSGLIGTDGEARRMLREAAALDALLDMAPVVPDARIAALADRIVAGAQATPRIVARSRRWQKPAASFYRRANAAAGFALAASLALGIFAGGNLPAATGVQDIAGAIGLDNGDSGSGQVALGDDSDTYANEDLL